jgi:ethanolamine utilization protein EutN
MQLGRVMGQAVATVKHPTLQGWRLLLVQLLTAEGKADGEPLLAIDSLGARADDLVILSNDGAGARELVKAKNSPARWMVLGIKDA